MTFLSLPREVQLHVVKFVDARTLRQLTHTSRQLSEMALDPAVLDTRVAGQHSALFDLAGIDNNVHTLDLASRQELLRKQEDLESGRFRAPSVSMQRSLGRGEHEASQSRRFRAIVSSTHLEVWDHFSDKRLLSEPLECRLPAEYQAHYHSRAFIYLEDDFIVIFRTHDGMSDDVLHKLDVEYISFQRLSGATGLQRRSIRYGFEDPARYWGWFCRETKQIRISKEPSGFVPAFEGHPFTPGTQGHVEHWDLAEMLDPSAQPKARFDNLAAFCAEGSAEKGWYIFITEEAVVHGVQGAPIHIPPRHVDPDRRSRRRSKSLRASQQPECTLLWIDFGEVGPFDDPYEFAMETSYQSIPRGRQWFMHVYDAFKQRGIEWPVGVQFEFSGPDNQEIEYFIDDRSAEELWLRDCVGNRWSVKRGGTVMADVGHTPNDDSDDSADEFDLDDEELFMSMSLRGARLAF